MLKKTGFTIIELLIFITLLSTVLVVAVSYITRLLFNMQTNEHRIRARFYAEEVVEWLNGERQADWQEFQDKAAVGGAEYCLNTELTVSTTLQAMIPAPCGGINNGYNGIAGIAPMIYKRTFILSKSTTETASQVTAKITVSWNDHEIEYTVPLETIYSIYE